MCTPNMFALVCKSGHNRDMIHTSICFACMRAHILTRRSYLLVVWLLFLFQLLFFPHTFTSIPIHLFSFTAVAVCSVNIAYTSFHTRICVERLASELQLCMSLEWTLKPSLAAWPIVAGFSFKQLQLHTQRGEIDGHVVYGVRYTIYT